MSTFNAKQLTELIKKDDWRFSAQYFSVSHSGSASKKAIKELVKANLNQKSISSLKPMIIQILKIPNCLKLEKLARKMSLGPLLD